MSKRIKREIVVNGEKRWITGANEQEYAEKCARLMKAAAEPQTQDAGSKHGFREYADNWFNVFSKPNIAKVTAITYERQLRLHIYPVLGEKNIEDITPIDVQTVFNRMGNVTKATKNKAKIVLNMVLEQAVEENLLRKNPLTSKSIRITGAASKPTPPYSIEQMQYLVRHIGQVKEARGRAYLALHALHPLRLEEVLGLQGRDIDDHSIHVRRAVTHPDRNQPEIKETKTEDGVRVVDLVEQIKQYLPKTAPHDYILGGAKPLTCTEVEGICERIQHDTGFDERVTPIRFRTTVLTDIYDQTKDVKQTMHAAGHTNEITTLKYYIKGRSEHSNTAAPVAAAYGL